VDLLTLPSSESGLPPAPQAVLQTLTKAAIFLVATINSGSTNCASIRAFCGDLPGLLQLVSVTSKEISLA